MKIAIIYTTKGSTTSDCAKLLAKELKNHSLTLTDMKNIDIDFKDYDAIVVGFPIYMGRIKKSARKFLTQYREALLENRVGYYMCCGLADCFEDYAQRLIPSDLKEKAFAVSCFGGSLDPSRFKGIDKMIVKALRSEILGGGENGGERDDMVLPTIFEENIAQFADRLVKR